MTETLRARDLALIPATTLAVMILNVLASFAFVWLYSIFWNPGHPEAFYQEFALRAAPPSSVVCGFFLMFAAGWFVSRGRPAQAGMFAALLVALLYVAIDLGLFLLVGATGSIWGWGLLSWATKLIAAAVGAHWHARRQAASDSARLPTSG